MGKDIQIKTSLTVHQFILVFKNNKAVEELREIDSINYGEGYDFKINNLECRLYSDEEFNGESLIIEIDRYDKFSEEEQNFTDLVIREIIA